MKNENYNEVLEWYNIHKRELPWRINTDAYSVWMSEIMLQQTRVEAVIPYFEKFKEKYPTIVDFAQASDDDLNKMWEGLGYYRRVRNMKKCAIVCSEEYGGRFPETYEELLALPGIGMYTAGAIASIAYNQKVPAVDGNVMRVMSRYYAIYDDITKDKSKKDMFKLLSDVIDKQPGNFNQAIMDIGSQICIPNGAARCNICPLSTTCKAYEKGLLHILPKKSKKKDRRIEEKTVVILVHKNKVAITKRPDSGLLAGLYEFDLIDSKLNIDMLKELYSEYGINRIEELTDAKHIFTHIEWHMSAYLIEVNDEKDRLFISEKEFDTSYAIPNAFDAYKQVIKEYWRNYGK